MNNEELNRAYTDKFGKELYGRWKNDSAWIESKLRIVPQEKECIDPIETNQSPVSPVSVLNTERLDCKIDLSGVGFKDAPTIEKLRIEQIKAKCKRFGKRIMSDGKVWEILNFNEPSGSFKNGKRQQYKTARDADNAVDSL